MTKRKLSPGEKKLKALLSEKGSLTSLQNEMQTIADSAKKDDVFISLEKFLIAVATFQDKNRKNMDNLKAFFKGNENVMVHLGPLHVHIKISGRDIWKSPDKHKSFVKNKAGVIKKSRLSIRPTYEPVNDTRIFLVNDYYENAQPLSFVRSTRAIGIANERMVADLKIKIEGFLDENGNKISRNIDDLRDLLK